jgi:WhiB family transcriptional regulator, redox-sensing transcriptional regulator
MTGQEAVARGTPASSCHRLGRSAFSNPPVAYPGRAVALSHAELEYLMAPDEAPLPSLADLIPARPPWMAQALCRGMASGIFFPSRGEATDEAREVCATCPVAGPGLSYAVAEDLEGVWAGTSKRERRGMRRQAS